MEIRSPAERRRVPAETGWRPSPGERKWLVAGAAAALTHAVLLAVGAASEAAGETALGTGAELAGAVTDAVLLGSMYSLARSVARVSLWRSSLAFIGFGWLLALLALGFQEEESPWPVTVLLGSLVGGALLIWGIFRRPRWAEESAVPAEVVAAASTPPADAAPAPAAPAPTPRRPKPSKRGLGVAVAVGGYFTFKLLAKGLAKLSILRGGTLLVRHTDVVLGVEMVVFLVAFLAASVWWGVAKIRARRRLGGFAVLSGCADLAVSLTVLVCVGWWGATAFAAANDGEAISDSALDSAGLVMTTVAGVQACALGAWLLALRGRTAPTPGSLAALRS